MKAKRTPDIDGEYNTKTNELVTVKYYNPEKDMVTYIHNGNQYTKKRTRFMLLLAGDQTK